MSRARSFLYAGAVLGLLMCLAGCNNDGNTSNSAPSSPCASGSDACPANGQGATPPPASGEIVTQSSFSPGAGAAGIPTAGTTITVAVQGGVDPTSYSYGVGSASNIQLVDSGGKQIPIQVTPSSLGLTITTAGCNLYPSTTYTVSVSGLSNQANPPQTLSGTVTSTFTTNSTYSPPACEDPKLTWTAPTANTNGTALAPTAISNYTVYYDNLCGASNPLNTDDPPQTASVPANSQANQTYTFSQYFPPGTNARFAITACASGACSVLSNQVCTVVDGAN